MSEENVALVQRAITRGRLDVVHRGDAALRLASRWVRCSWWCSQLVLAAGRGVIHGSRKGASPTSVPASGRTRPARVWGHRPSGSWPHGRRRCTRWAACNAEALCCHRPSGGLPRRSWTNHLTRGAQPGLERRNPSGRVASPSLAALQRSQDRRDRRGFPKNLQTRTNCERLPSTVSGWGRRGYAPPALTRPTRGCRPRIG
jgi:hypothetical protein